MGNKVFIIHSSEIIQQGLHNLIQSKFDIESILLHSIEGVKNYSTISNSRIILLVDSQVDQALISKTIGLLNTNNLAKIIMIRERTDPLLCEDVCDCCVSVMESKSRIHELISAHLQIRNATSDKMKSTWLTAREVEVVKLVAFGKTNKDIAEKLCISIHTVISHRKNITEKLGIKSISGLTVYAILNSLIDANSIDLE